MKRIRVPEFLAQAFNQSEAWMDLRNEMHDYRSFFMPLHIQRKLLEDVLKALSEHPQVPTDDQINELWEHWAVPLDASAKGLGVDGPSRDQIRDTCVEWQRRCFQEEEPEIPAEIEDLLWKPHGTYISDEQLKIVESQCSRHNDALSEAYRRGLRKGEQK